MEIKVLFVCLGNICRSPLAEGVFLELIKESELNDKIKVDSAGTSAYHIGELADYRTRQTAEQHGIKLTHKARQVQKEDFQLFDYVLAADKSNYNNLKVFQSANDRASLHLIREWEGKNLEVPDPYYGTLKDFEEGYQILKKALKPFLEYLRACHGI